MNLEKAADDIRYLLDRGYPQESAVRFVCAHHRLDASSMHLLSRSVLAKNVSEKRRAKFLPCDIIRGNTIVIDGYNILIALESILEKKAFICDDGVIRDIKGAFRNYEASESTETAIELALQFLKEKSPSFICFLFDAQISKSALLAKKLREKLLDFGLRGDARTSKHVDFSLKSSEYIVASSDGVIIDEAERVVNFLHCLASRFEYLEKGVVLANFIQNTNHSSPSF